MFVPLRFGLFRMNEQVRVVTRSLSRLEVVRDPSASPRLSQDKGSIAKNRRGVRGGLQDLSGISLLRESSLLAEHVV